MKTSPEYLWHRKQEWRPPAPARGKNITSFATAKARNAAEIINDRLNGAGTFKASIEYRNSFSMLGVKYHLWVNGISICQGVSPINEFPSDELMAFVAVLEPGE